MKRETKFWITIIIMGIIILVGLVIYSYNYVLNKGAQLGVNAIVNQINSQASIPILYTEGNSTIVKWISIKDVCGGGTG